MSNFTFEDNNDINVNIENNEDINVSVQSLDYIPGYKQYEAERRNNETQRQTNETTRINNETARQQLYQEVNTKLNNGDFNGTDGVSPTVNVAKVDKTTTITITDINGNHIATILDGEDGTGTGDMLKTIYDTNNNGIVDNAEKVNNHTVEKDVPSNAVFTDTIYDDTNVGKSIAVSIDSSTYVMTIQLKNQAGVVLSSGTVDLPLETMVVGASYDSTNKSIILTLQSGSTVSFSVADLVSGLVSTSDLSTALSDYYTKTAADTLLTQKADASTLSSFMATAIESGSNNNGSYIKYYDGTMICYGTTSISGVIVQTAFGNVWETASQINFGTFPQEFIAIPQVSIQQISGAMAPLEQLNNTTTTSIGRSYIWRPTIENNLNATYSWIAIGKWK